MSGQAIAIIQARMSSSRLPGKVMMPLAGHPMIWHIVERARACRFVEKVVVATSTEKSDDPLAAFCQQEGIDCFRGSLDNVLSRFIKILDDYPYEYCVRITGDCPLIDPNFIDLQIRALMTYSGDHCWLSEPIMALSGQGVHSTRALRVVASNSVHPDDLEHVGSRYFCERQQEFVWIGIEPPAGLSHSAHRLSVDEPSDLDVMTHLYSALWDQKPIDLHAAIKWLRENPAWAMQNAQVVESEINQEMAERRVQQSPSLSFFYNQK